MKFKTAVHAISLGLAMFALWLLLSGHYNPLLIGLGVVSCVLIVAMAMRLDVVDHEAIPLHLHLNWFTYIAWLGAEIAKSNLHVAKIVLNPSLPISPVMVRTRALQKSELGKVIYANSITLTPGTVSIDFDGDEIIVHAITREAAQSLLTDDMNRRVVAIEAR